MTRYFCEVAKVAKWRACEKYMFYCIFGNDLCWLLGVSETLRIHPPKWA